MTDYSRSIKIIRDSALERFPIKLMLSDIAGKDEERRNRALTCFVFLKLNGSLAFSVNHL